MKKKRIIKLFLIFVIFSIIGSFYEQILLLIINLINNKQFIWKRNSILLISYFRPVYGLGAILYTLLLKKNNDLITNFIIASIIGGTLEYIVSLFQELTINSVFWDYSDKFLNINGRTTIIYALFWGILGIIYIKYIYPTLSKLLNRISNNTNTIIITFLIIFLTYDMTLSFSVLIRQRLRQDNYTYLTPIGKIYDIKYNDFYLKEKYPYLITK